ncbi:salicylate hydroxylase [Allocatelliglobosispora scoriae]|uniref:Salicylate hydroxylase n=1 Tax=Allocatelliglobosispora scoriae TaxID=643052 RepID=A0A841C131_9ACTN|nr:FAD-dependent monooxygenase [Allocatelliglobosispora scoriae]MBB5873635.1 salicylate hydroxylase [Allocatelliglobosispora scoriae]
MGEQPVGIVGAGIAGLTLAVALQRRGLSYHVFEQAPRFGEVGAGIQLAPNATRLLYRLGLGDALDAVAVRPHAIELRDGRTGTVMARTELGERCVAEYGAPYLAVHRADLHQILAGAVDPAAVTLGVRCTGIDQDGEVVTAAFDNGRRDRFAVLAGADGVRSAVRSTFLHDAPRYSGHTIFRGLIPAERLPQLAAEPRIVLWLGPGQHAVAYPVAGGKLISFGATMPEAEWGAESWSEPGSLSGLREAYEGWDDGLRDLLSQADEVSRWALHDRDPIIGWTHGTATLIGDAAHPMLPFVAQGANQAVEDAYVLAGCLAQAPVPEALRRYERLRRPRTDEVQEISRRNATALHDGSRPDPAQQQRQQRWLFGYDPEEG